MARLDALDGSRVGFQGLLNSSSASLFILRRQRRLAEKLVDTIGVRRNRKKVFHILDKKVPE